MKETEVSAYDLHNRAAWFIHGKDVTGEPYYACTCDTSATPVLRNSAQIRSHMAEHAFLAHEFPTATGRITVTRTIGKQS